MRPILLSIAAAGVLAVRASAQQAPNPSIEGLWVARDVNAPVHGTLLIIERGGALGADLAGFSVPVTASGNAAPAANPTATIAHSVPIASPATNQAAAVSR